MQWKPEYSIGVQEIDDQHKLLIAQFARLEAIVEAGREWQEAHLAIIELAEVARYHFAFEEALMRLLGMPGAREHQKNHEKFFEEIAKIERHALLDSAKREMIEFLFGWLQLHICVSDREDYGRRLVKIGQVVKA